MLLGKAHEARPSPFTVKWLNPSGVENEMVLFAQSHWHKAGGEFAFHGDCINFGKGKELFLDFWSKSYIFNVFLL